MPSNSSSSFRFRSRRVLDAPTHAICKSSFDRRNRRRRLGGLQRRLRLDERRTPQPRQPVSCMISFPFPSLRRAVGPNPTISLAGGLPFLVKTSVLIGGTSEGFWKNKTARDKRSRASEEKREGNARIWRRRSSVRSQPGAVVLASIGRSERNDQFSFAHVLRLRYTCGEVGFLENLRRAPTMTVLPFLRSLERVSVGNVRAGPNPPVSEEK